MVGNLGSTRLKRPLKTNTMQNYDALPAPLRRWVAQAALPWSARSCHKIWSRAQARGEGLSQIITRLDRAEKRALERDRAARFT
ncbi:DUF6525 family protein [Thioclava sp. GXIMD4216]|uniref:DUF6525 family protein n=1 Tax=Thioclava litoralis TaxID=3076557 RepID=A0ABZ1E1C2_9RHOB|nr:DUF6525 family protein [Thioclava sp. FTW29]